MKRPRSIGGQAVWGDRWRTAQGLIEVWFAGRGPDPRASRESILELLGPPSGGLAWARQVHSTRVLSAVAGGCGDGDGLVTVAVGLALSVITADCVPVLLATAEGHLAAIHAGWRGIAGGIVPVAARELPRDGQQVRAWIGPAIGPCCYEVEGDVARAVAEASSAEAVVPGAGRDGRPHLDLRLAVRHQLEREGFPSPRRLGPCTRCHPEWLHSYRGSGPAAGRNVAFIWRV